MYNVKINFNNSGRGNFFIQEDGKTVAEMEIGIKNNTLIVYHTEVIAEMEGKGLAKKLFNFMVDHARDHQLKVRPLCSFTASMFNKEPGKYQDIWINEKE